MRTNQPQQPTQSVYLAIAPEKQKGWLKSCQAFLFHLVFKEPSNSGGLFHPIMKAFIVLALCCSFFSSSAIPLAFEFSDCDDPDVFKAVDTALKKYNEDTATGNQFALYVVMEAKRTVSRLCKKKKKKSWNCLCTLNQHISISFVRGQAWQHSVFQKCF